MMTGSMPRFSNAEAKSTAASMQFAELATMLSRGVRIRSLMLVFAPNVSELFTYESFCFCRAV